MQPKRVKHYLRHEAVGNNHKHQADLAFFRTKSNGFAGFLCVIDVYSRYAGVEPFKTKSAQSILNAYETILKRSELDWPRQFVSDDGNEFKGEFAKMLKKKDIQHIQAQPGVHTTTAIVDRFIYTLKQRVVRKMNFKKNDEWDKYVKQFANTYNKEIHETINTTPESVIKDETVPIIQRTKIKKQPLLKVGTKVRIKLAEQRGINRNRATDRKFWSDEEYLVKKAEYSPENVRYYRIEKKNGEMLSHVFYPEELLVV